MGLYSLMPEVTEFEDNIFRLTPTPLSGKEFTIMKRDISDISFRI
jgi:hypothetical protein